MRDVRDGSVGEAGPAERGAVGPELVSVRARIAIEEATVSEYEGQCKTHTTKETTGNSMGKEGQRN